MRILKKYKSRVKKAKKILAKSNLMLLGNGKGSLFATKYLNMNYLLVSLKQLKYIINKFVHIHGGYQYPHKKVENNNLTSGIDSKKLKRVEPKFKFKVVIVCENDRVKEAYLANYIQKLITRRKKITKIKKKKTAKAKKRRKKELNLTRIICTKPISEIRKLYRTGNVRKTVPALYFATNDAIFLELKKLLGNKTNVSCSLIYNKELYGQGYWSLPSGLDTWFFFKYQLLFLISYIGLLLKKRPALSSFPQLIPNVPKTTKTFKSNFNHKTNYKYKNNHYKDKNSYYNKDKSNKDKNNHYKDKNNNKNSFEFKKDYKKNKNNNSQKNKNKQPKQSNNAYHKKI